MNDIRKLRVDVNEPTPKNWVWQVSKGSRLLCISAKSYGSKGACLKAFYEVQDYLLHAVVFINGKEQG